MDRRTALIIALSAATIAFILAAFITYCPMPGFRLLIVMTGSMDGNPMPYGISTIPLHSLVLLHEDPECIGVGDVIGYRIPGMEEPFLHRVSEITDGGYVLKGDNAPTSELIADSDVVGKVIGVYPLIGRLMFFLRTHAFYLIGLTLILAILFRSIQYIREEEEI